MGYYINTDSNHSKAKFIVENLGGRIIDIQEAHSAILDKTKAVVVVVDNGYFEAAAFCFSSNEFMEFTSNDDHRRKEIIVMDRDLCKQLTGYNGE